MRVLLSDGSGLTARQTAAQLADAGHTIGVLSPDPLCLARFTRRVRHVWRVPPYGPDPLRWLDAMFSVYRSTGADVLVPTQEQVAVLSACEDLVRAAEVRTAVPSFEALSQVQDKLSAFATLTAAELPQPVARAAGIPAAAHRPVVSRGSLSLSPVHGGPSSLRGHRRLGLRGK